MSSWDDQARQGYQEDTGWAGPAASARPSAAAVFGRTMFLVALISAFCAAGAYLGRDLSGAWTLGLWLVAIALTFAVRPARERGEVSPVQMGLVFTIGLIIGLAIGPSIDQVVEISGSVLVAQAAGLTALFMALLGTIGYLTRRDLSAIGRICFFALLGLIGFALVGIFVTIPAFTLIWSIAGLVIFAGLTAWDFQRLRRAGTEEAAVLALSIFLDALNVFMFILNLLSLSRD